MHLPETFRQTIKSVHGARGENWLDGFGELVRYCEAKWGLRIVHSYDLTFNYVASVQLEDGTEAALKLCVPHKESRSEEQALRWYDGRGAVRVIDSEPDRGILLMESVKPGYTLHMIQDDKEAMLAAAQVMRRLWRPAPAEVHAFASVAGWTDGLKRLRRVFDGGTGPLPERMVELAENTFEQLLHTSGQPLLLHGDLHHGNILAGERDPWIAIDPKGVIGEAEYEVCALLTNNLPADDQIGILRNRVNVLASALELDRIRILKWAVSFGVLSAFWCVEDGVGDPMAAIGRAELFERLLSELQ
ncbi:aminoglycoside phosphotransferase family protein [Cohnella panacarvi]|uniref:aminoglycoside phosphotransferase family protein n=1 Tax=Cohnella panacarvi TaxID=400776 RepID=UPI00047A67CE|nr:aminoglycoside phosphotransferase family protein [Cohnella panacarvi]